MADTNTELTSLLDIIKKADIIKKRSIRQGC